MHPARSVIVFTTLSGIGFGLLIWLGIGRPVVIGLPAFWMYALAYLLAVGGLLSSTLHLGHPERALKAFSQWKTSWLSREGCGAVACLLVMAAYGAGLVFFETRIAVLGWIGAALALGTVFTTSMIYAQLKTVPRWNHWTTPALFLSLCLAGGAILAGQMAALPLLALAGVAQLANWMFGDGRFAASGSTISTATGLGPQVRAFEPPHTGTNYLLREFVFTVARKHVARLRIIALVLGYGLPLLLVGVFNVWWAFGLAAVTHLAGILASRWLFFAQAEHVVGLYYGKR